MKGLIVYVYKNPLGDCTNNGISSMWDSLILVGDKIPEIFDSSSNDVVELKLKFYNDQPYYYVEPVGETRHCMFGGNFIYSSDSRFPADYPIPIHDRIE